MIIIGLIVNIILCVYIIPMYIGQKRKIGYIGSLIACLILSPLLGLLITLAFPRKEIKQENEETQKEIDSSITKDKKEDSHV